MYAYIGHVRLLLVAVVVVIAMTLILPENIVLFVEKIIEKARLNWRFILTGKFTREELNSCNSHNLF